MKKYICPEVSIMRMEARMIACSRLNSNLDGTEYGGSASGSGIYEADVNGNSGWELW